MKLSEEQKAPLSLSSGNGLRLSTVALKKLTAIVFVI